MEIKPTIKKIKKYRSIVAAVEWWNNLPIQNLEEPLESWSGYCMKYYPKRGSCYGFTEKEIYYIWQNEKSI